MGVCIFVVSFAGRWDGRMTSSACWPERVEGNWKRVGWDEMPLKFMSRPVSAFYPFVTRAPASETDNGKLLWCVRGLALF